VAEAVRAMGLRYAVVTSATRDDLPDGGASAFARTVRSLKALEPAPLVEVLIPDYTADRLDAVLGSGPDVLAHNLEVVERLSPAIRHAGFDYRRSLEVLRSSRALAPRIATKSSLLLGLGETRDEVLRAMADLREAGVDILVLGQYLRPSRRQVAVREYLRPEDFDRLADEGRRMGFGHASAGPLVRTSYRAAESYVEHGTRPASEA
jgi:lipoic acid synthetase